MKFSPSHTRREFVKKGLQSGFSLILGAHLLPFPQFSGAALASEPRISELKLLTAVPIQEMVAFYSGLLGLPILVENDTCCSFRAGASVLAFTYVPVELNPPFYHFAFNIPQNKIKQAEAWQAAKSEIIEPPGRLQDLPNYNKNIVFFRHWNAHSVFFYDPAGNLVEYIARHTLHNDASGDFNTKDILYLSEIGLVVDDVTESSTQLAKKIDIHTYRNSNINFRAMGDEMGLLLFMNKGGKAVFGRGRNRRIYETEVLLNGLSVESSLTLGKYPYVIH